MFSEIDFNSKLKIFAGLCVLFVFFVFLSFSNMISKKLLENHHPENNLIWIIEPGDNLKIVLSDLHDKNLISNKSLLYWYARLSKKESLKVGEYSITQDDSFETLLLKFGAGDTINYAITFIEGWNFDQWINHLKSHEYFNEFVYEDLKILLKKAGFQGSNPEGWFFPDTYYYTSQSDPADILKKAHAKMLDLLEQKWSSVSHYLPLGDSYEALILASIIEKETGTVSEQKTISAVFNNRLKIGMRLQTDPTVIYGLGSDFDGDLIKSDLKKRTPYNTYVIDGLPPTPICMPGEKAIEAAVNPANDSALYFVAKGDGTHQFSDNFDEHQKAVKKYQIIGRSDNYRTNPD